MNFSEELKQIDAKGLSRSLQALPAIGGKFEWDGRTILNFSSNDYLNLATDIRLKEATMQATQRWGCGATASRLMCGHLELHDELEAQLAALVRQESALVFPSGFQANLAVFSTLGRRGDAIFSDELNHASIIDGCRLSRADVFVYRHRDMEHLEYLLRSESDRDRKIVASDSVFSMDGDEADVARAFEISRRHQAILVVDEAHAIGVLGQGGGLCRERGIPADIVVGTMSKSLGASGGFAAGSAEFKRLLINRARSFIFSTGLAPGAAASALEAARILVSTPTLGETLQQNARRFRELLSASSLDVRPSESQIVPVRIGNNQKALEISRSLLADGLWIRAVRPPTVPEGTSRLRLSVTLAHTENDLVKAVDLISRVACADTPLTAHRPFSANAQM